MITTIRTLIKTSLTELAYLSTGGRFSLLLFAFLSSQVALAGTVGSTPLPQLEPLTVHATTTRNVVEALALRHYVPTLLDDELSSRIHDTYLDNLDPGRNYFLATDIAEFERYRFDMDDALLQGNLEAAFVIFNRYRERVVTRFEQVVALLEDESAPFDFTRQENLIIDREDALWADTSAELDDLWRKRIKDAILRLELADKEEGDIRELLTKRFTNRLARSLQTNSEDVYQIYMNSFTSTYDPHTQYFSPRTSENFNITMSLSLEGIGAVLGLEDEYTQIVSLVPAGPADKAGQLKPNDKIIGVGQGEAGDMVDVIGWRLDEVVQLIRGKAGTVVRLDIIPASAGDSANSKIIQITRNKVTLEEQAAKSDVIEIEQFGHAYKIGVIDIPAFYVDFKAMQQGKTNFKSTTRDVTKLLEALIEQDVDAIVVDLRGNGGGSLHEAKTLTGLFIDHGPVVQVRSKNNRVDILVDQDTRVVYDGPLAVLVNRLSASASEIFAGAVQDYQRGLVIGSQTFGKGTVQTLLPMNQGQLKLTQAKFYRITGESTQHRGIIPDITLPSNYDSEDIGESTLDAPLRWDQIRPAAYNRKGSLQPLLATLKKQHRARLIKNPEFSYVQEAFSYRKAKRNENSVSLNEETRRTEKAEQEAFWVALENKKRLAQGLPIIASLAELEPKEPDVAQSTPTSISGPGAIVPDAESSEPVTGSEMAGAAGGISQDAPGTAPTGSSPRAEDNSAAPGQLAGQNTAETPAGAEEPGPYLLEAGLILLDIIALENRTAAGALHGSEPGS